jgi:hypothetical protein
MVVAALLGFAGVYVANRTRKPVQTQDLWNENRELRKEVREQSDRINIVEDKFEKRDQVRLKIITMLSDGIDVMWHYIKAMQEEWGHGTIPILSDEDLATINMARHLRLLNEAEIEENTKS